MRTSMLIERQGGSILTATQFHAAYHMQFKEEPIAFELA